MARYATYKKFRSSGMVAHHAIYSARVLDAWLDAKTLGLVRLKATPEEENYFDVYGEPDTKKEREQIIDYIDRWGCWYVASFTKCPCCQSWQQADGVGMCIYKDPCNPFENCYVIDLMKSALDALQERKAA